MSVNVPLRRLRVLAATATAGTGMTQIGLLWLEDLSWLLLQVASIGFAYLLLALGLLGRSPLSLVLTALLTLLCTTVLLRSAAPLSAMGIIVTLINPSIAVCCLWILYGEQALRAQVRRLNRESMHP
jgi:hypothetical protein